MPGAVTHVLVREGDAVSPGQPLVIVETMKMEHVIRARRAGRVRALRVREEDQVEAGTVVSNPLALGTLEVDSSVLTLGAVTSAYKPQREAAVERRRAPSPVLRFLNLPVSCCSGPVCSGWSASHGGNGRANLVWFHAESCSAFCADTLTRHFRIHPRMPSVEASRW
jgi:hypothetical protein